MCTSNYSFNLSTTIYLKFGLIDIERRLRVQIRSINISSLTAVSLSALFLLQPISSAKWRVTVL
jgi:hypothetical protein